jgi:hypothetical protein
MIVANKMPASGRRVFPSTEQLLVEGGDARIALGPDGLNKYGLPSFPDPGLVALGSSTASGISAEGFAAADRLRGRLLVGAESDMEIYARELNRVRQELVRLCGVSDISGLETVCAASGTDLHLIAAQISRTSESGSMLAIMVDEAETGSGVQAALAGRHFSSRAALGGAVKEGASFIGGGESASSGSMQVATVPVRLADGRPRQLAEVDAEFESLATRAVAAGQRVLLVLADVSKTGLVAPSPACILALHQRLSGQVDVLVDACQFRLAPSTLCAYLEHGFMVALTGSKFVGGPPFSGALFIPSAVATRLSGRPLPHALAAYSSRADWPDSWDTAKLDNAANFGLLLRWEAALEELRAFRSAPESEVASFLREFAHAVRKRLTSDPVFELLPAPELDRNPLSEADGWDTIQTIFSFLLIHPQTRLPLSREETARIYRLLQIDLSNRPEFGLASAIAALRCQLGQPVACGIRDGVPVGALRICASARMVVEATLQSGSGASAVIGKALAALDKTALLTMAS